MTWCHPERDVRTNKLLFFECIFRTANYAQDDRGVARSLGTQESTSIRSAAADQKYPVHQQQKAKCTLENRR